MYAVLVEIGLQFITLLATTIYKVTQFTRSLKSTVLNWYAYSKLV